MCLLAACVESMESFLDATRATSGDAWLAYTSNTLMEFVKTSVMKIRYSTQCGNSMFTFNLAECTFHISIYILH